MAAEPDQPDQPDPFDALGVPPSFRLTATQIERAYLTRAAQAHPDAHADAHTSADAAQAASGMAHLNDARRRLRHAETRARALLHRHGLHDPADDALPDGFLMSMLETRMEIEAAIAGGDEAERTRWAEWAERRRAEHAERIAELFDDLDAGGDQDAIGAHIRVELNAWRYIERLIEQLDPAYDPDRADFGA